MARSADRAFNRRTFLAGAGAVFVESLKTKPIAAQAAAKGDMLFASACRFGDGHYGALIVNEWGAPITAIDLPGRGHDVVISPDRRQAIAFARRPGNFAVAFSPSGMAAPQTINAPEGRHFFGHGAFSADGRWLYAAENDFDAGRGCIGIYLAREQFRRIGEFDSYGVGPHEIARVPGSNILAVCNGGIETHPDFGRTKLNLDRMRPSLVFIDLSDGRLIERHEPPAELHQLSIRHMAVSSDGLVIFGGQYQGAATDLPPLFGTVRQGEPMALVETPSAQRALFRNYIGSMAISAGGQTCAVASPRGNLVAIISTSSGEILRQWQVRDGCGIAFDGNNLIASSGAGDIGTPGEMHRTELAFDNHLRPVIEGGPNAF